MDKIPVSIILDGKPIYSKPLLLDETLATLRETIKQRIDMPYNFIDLYDNPLKKENENSILLRNIINENCINLKSINDINEICLKIILNGKKFLSFNCSKKDNLNNIRSVINKKIQINFIFLDDEENLSTL